MATHARIFELEAQIIEAENVVAQAIHNCRTEREGNEDHLYEQNHSVWGTLLLNAYKLRDTLEQLFVVMNDGKLHEAIDQFLPKDVGDKVPVKDGRLYHLADELARVACDGRGTRARFIEHLMNEHNTRQQRVMALIVEFITVFSQAKAIDDRNRASSELAKAIMTLDPRLRAAVHLKR